MGFVHLHLHTEYSLLDGATKISELFNHIKDLGMDSVAITDHGNLHAVVQKYQLAKKAGVKLIFGFEAYIVDDISRKEKGQKRYHLVLLAENEEGYKNLVKLVSIANSEGFYYKARIDKETLRKHSKGLICLSACIANDIAQSIVKDNEAKARRLIEEYIDIFGKDNFFLEVENHSLPEEDKVREFYYKVADEYGLRIVATVDSHFLKKEDAKAHEIMLCIQTNSTIDNPNHFKFRGSGYHVCDEEEMKKLFPGRQDILDNTVEIAERCNVELKLGHHVFPNFELPEGKSDADYLFELCSKQLAIKYGGKPNFKEAKERMDFELSVVNKMEFATYFLIVQDFIKAAKAKCQVGPGRGSGAGSIVAYLLGITQLEPLSLGLLFERFLNPDRVSLPDFDVDFGDKDIALDYVQHKYGEEKVALIGTFGTMSAKSAFKDVARAFAVPFSIANEVTNFITEKTIQKSLDLKDDRTGKLINQELIDYKNEYPEVFEIAQRLEGCVRHKGIHACGVVWGKEPVTNYVPIYTKDGMAVTQVDGHEVEAAGLVKFDFLGLETLNITKQILNMIGKSDEWLEKISLTDDKVYEMLRVGDSVGTFQMESAGMQKTLRLVKPTCFDDIIAILALYRPGSMDFIDTYAARKDGTEKFEYIHPDTKPILKPTYGILVYQEQVMQLSRVLANFSMGESDVLRKAIGKKKIDLMNQMEEKFKSGCINHAKMQEKVVNELWDNIVKFASYSFNKSHAAAYALIAYRTAYLKYYYPVEFMAALISASTNNPDKMTFYINAARDCDIKLLCPAINFSERSFTVEKTITGKKVRFGLSGIKNVGEEALQEIIRKRPYSSFQDFINKVDLSKINKRVLKSLITVGCFDDFQYNRKQLLAIHEDIKKEDNSGGTQMTLFGTVSKSVVYPDLPDMTLKEKMEVEEELIGACISGHPLDLYAESNMKHFQKFDGLRDGRDAELFGLIEKYKPVTTRNGDNMAFITLVNKNNKIDVVVFPDSFEEYLLRREVKENDGIIVEGKYQEAKGNKPASILANKVKFPPQIKI